MNIQLAKGVRPQGGQYVFIFASKMLLGILTASISKWNIRLDLPKSTCRRQNTGNSGGFHRGSQLHYASGIINLRKKSVADLLKQLDQPTESDRDGD
jgi:hypothetical protein